MEFSPINLQNRPDFPVLQKTFRDTGRLQVRNFLKNESAEALRTSLGELPWRLVLNENGKHIDIHPVQIQQLGAKKVRLIKKAAQSRARQEFQYLYENYPVFDIANARGDLPEIIESVFKNLNGQDFRNQLSEMTGLPVDFCDIQATRYRPGHFLTTHDDGVEGKNRQLAYVLNLSQRWREGWGGCLKFTDKGGHVIDRYLPVFNSLSLFRVPQDHEVTRVRPSAKSSRVSLTGWFRTR